MRYVSELITADVGAVLVLFLDQQQTQVSLLIQIDLVLSSLLFVQPIAGAQEEKQHDLAPRIVELLLGDALAIDRPETI